MLLFLSFKFKWQYLDVYTQVKEANEPKAEFVASYIQVDVSVFIQPVVESLVAR